MWECLVVRVLCMCALMLVQVSRPGFLHCSLALRMWRDRELARDVTSSRPLHWPGRGLTQVEWWAQSGWRRGYQCVKSWLCGGGLAPPTQEMGCVVVMGNCAFQAVLYYWHFLWTSGVLLSWPLPAQLSVHWMHISGSSCHNPAADTIEWELDIFHVVVICAPPPILLVFVCSIWKARHADSAHFSRDLSTFFVAVFHEGTQFLTRI